jgi:bacillithiol system protein YtxJ
MTNRLQTLTTLDELETAVAGSSARPILLFKHSTTCGTSARAHKEIETLLSRPPLRADVYVVSMQAGRAISNAIAQRFDVRHESPQVLLVYNGAVIWHASHGRVTKDAIVAALQRHVPPVSGEPPLT